VAINKLVVGLAGMPGSGKSLVMKVAQENGYDIVIMGDVVREETQKRGLTLTPNNVGKVMLDLRSADGDSVIAKRCIPRIIDTKTQKVFVDGIRSLNEVEEFKNAFPKFTLLAIHSSPETRFKRLYHRKRSDDPADSKIFNQRDERELSVGLGNAIAMAEYVILNEEDFQTVKRKAREALRKAEEKWKK
jgi:dephospho-CoA kinase